MSGSAKALISHSPNETTQVGSELAKRLAGGDLVLIQGQMGVGKTLLARGILRGLGAEGWRGSPTYALIHEYEGPVSVYHVDLYRLAVEEVEHLGLEELARSDAIVLVEWPERGVHYLERLATSTLVTVDMSMIDAGVRLIEVRCAPARNQADLTPADFRP